LERSNPTAPAFIAAVFLAQLGLFVVISRLRLVDGDEGFYLMASRLVIHGQLPYRDFLLTQMPLVPYVYGAWMWLTGMTWLSGRLLSAILTTCLGTLLGYEAARLSGRRTAGVVAVVLFVTSTHVVAWLPLVKTYGLSTLLLFLAYWFAVRAGEHALTWVAAGLCLGLSTDARLYFAALFPIFAVWVWRRSAPKHRKTALAAFTVGFAAALAPNLYLMASGPDAWYFDNIGFHSIRSSGGPIKALQGKALILTWLLLTGGDGNGAQVMLLLLAVFMLVRRSGYVTSEARFALALSFALAILCFLPNPPFVQYLCVILPFLILFVATGLGQWAAHKGNVAAAGCVGVTVFAVLGVMSANRFLNSGELVAGVLDPKFATEWRIPSILAVSAAVNERVRPGEQVLSLWPGYLFESKSVPFVGLENNAGTYVAEVLTPVQQKKFRILSSATILGDIAAGKPRVVVLGHYEYALRDHPPFRETLLRAGYRLEREFGTVTLWMQP
jgi:4-amino-4-deoxy-L-arabinose transferase-like glycosyltransferase